MDQLLFPQQLGVQESQLSHLRSSHYHSVGHRSSRHLVQLHPRLLSMGFFVSVATSPHASHVGPLPNHLRHSITLIGEAFQHCTPRYLLSWHTLDRHYKEDLTGRDRKHFQCTRHNVIVNERQPYSASVWQQYAIALSDKKEFNSPVFCMG